MHGVSREAMGTSHELCSRVVILRFWREDIVYDTAMEGYVCRYGAVAIYMDLISIRELFTFCSVSFLSLELTWSARLYIYSIMEKALLGILRENCVVM